MDLEGIMFREISHTGQEKYCILSIICGNLFKKIAKLIDLKLVAGGRRVGEIRISL